MGMLEEGSYHLARHLLISRMIGEMTLSQAPNKALLAIPPPVDPAEQLLLLLRCRHAVGWTDDPTCPDCFATDHIVAHLFSCPSHWTDLAPRDMWVAPLQALQFLVGLPQFSDLIVALQIISVSFPSKPSIPPCALLLSGPRWEHFFFSSPHFMSCYFAQ